MGSEEKTVEYLRTLVRKIVKDFHIPVNEYSLDKILYYITRDYVGYNKIDVMMREPLIEDVSCNGMNILVYVRHREHESIPSNVSFNSTVEFVRQMIALRDERESQLRSYMMVIYASCSIFVIIVIVLYRSFFLPMAIEPTRFLRIPMSLE